MAILSIGHSTLSYEGFLKLLRSAGVTAVADVRSSPYSRRYPHFNRDELKAELRADGIAYSFLGEELGGRPRNPAFFCDGVADYEKMRAAREFGDGLERVIKGAQDYRLALMCSEHNPLDCHRCLLVGRALINRRIEVDHILSSGKLKSQASVELELIAMLGMKTNGLFAPSEEDVAEAYKCRSARVAYAKPTRTNFIAAE